MIDIQSGFVIGACLPRHPVTGFLKFLCRIERATRKAVIDIVCPTFPLGTEHLRFGLGSQPLFHLHITPRGASDQSATTPLRFFGQRLWNDPHQGAAPLEKRETITKDRSQNTRVLLGQSNWSWSSATTRTAGFSRYPRDFTCSIMS